MQRSLVVSMAAAIVGCAASSAPDGWLRAEGSAPDLSSPPPPDGPVALAPQERGRYLVDHVVACPACHSPRDATGALIPGRYMAGWECFQELPDGSCLNPKNLTSAPTGLANRTDDEIKRMFLDGVRPPATQDAPIHPGMPYWRLHTMTAEDAGAIVSYLRTIAPVDRWVPRSGPAFDVDAPAPPLDVATLPAANGEGARRGFTLAVLAGCIDCHTPLASSGPVLDPSRYFAGGRVVNLPPPFGPVVAGDLSSRGRLAGWTVADVVTALRTGRGKDGRAACPPFLAGPDGAYAALQPGDAEAIASYILSPGTQRPPQGTAGSPGAQTGAVPR